MPHPRVVRVGSFFFQVCPSFSFSFLLSVLTLPEVTPGKVQRWYARSCMLHQERNPKPGPPAQGLSIDYGFYRLNFQVGCGGIRYSLASLALFLIALLIQGAPPRKTEPTDVPINPCYAFRRGYYIWTVCERQA